MSVQIVFTGSDGQRYTFLAKPKDDLRKVQHEKTQTPSCVQEHSIRSLINRIHQPPWTAAATLIRLPTCRYANNIAVVFLSRFDSRSQRSNAVVWRHGLRQDNRMMEMNGVLNRLLAKSPDSRRRNLHLRRCVEAQPRAVTGFQVRVRVRPSLTLALTPCPPAPVGGVGIKVSSAR